MGASASALRRLRTLERRADLDELLERVPVARRAGDVEPVLEDRVRELRAADAVRIVEIDLGTAELDHLGSLVCLEQRALRSRVGNTREEHHEQLARIR